jgi:hypothetical protein
MLSNVRIKSGFLKKSNKMSKRPASTAYDTLTITKAPVQANFVKLREMFPNWIKNASLDTMSPVLKHLLVW